jgi:hypothetical protein
LIIKTLKDLDSLDRATAEKEVDHYLMDAEMVNLYIEFGKRREMDPDFQVPKEPEESPFNAKNAAFAYVAFIASQNVPTLVRNLIAEKQMAGTWQDTHIGFFDEWVRTTAPTKLSAVVDLAVSTLTDN